MNKKQQQLLKIFVFLLCASMFCIFIVDFYSQNGCVLFFRNMNTIEKPAQGGFTRGDDDGVVVCTQQQRLEQIARMCEHYEGTHATRESTSHTIDNMTDTQILKLAAIWYVMPKLRTMGCLNWKTGSMTWRSVFFRNEVQSKYHLKEYPIPEIREMFKTYWKFMTIRHPLSRLVSAYKDKVVGDNGYARGLDRRIMKFFHKEIPTDNDTYRGTTFTEFLHFINANGSDFLMPEDGGHWHTLLSRCQPCAISFDHVVRTETYAEDARYIVDHRLRSQGHDTKVHVVHNTNPEGDTGARTCEVLLDEYQHVPPHLLTAMAQRYHRDMAVYGYNYTRLPTGTVRAECATLHNNGHTCC